MSTVFELLEAEWKRLADDQGAAQELGQVCQAAGGAATLGQVEEYVRAAAPCDADRVLVALVARAIHGHALAARVLLQLLLPGARRLAQRWWALGDQDERAAATIAAVYERIRHYPLQRRPHGWRRTCSWTQASTCAAPPEPYGPPPRYPASIPNHQQSTRRSSSPSCSWTRSPTMS